MRLDLNYKDIINLIGQLPEEQFEKLSDFMMNKKKKKINNRDNDIKELILNSPTWSQEEYEDYLAKRTHLNRFREK